MNKQKNFKHEIYELTKQIPYGNVATYGQLALLAGNPKAARAVGMIMKNNVDPINIPCYKVVASDGSLTGYSAGNGILTKKDKLFKDGVKFKNDKVDLESSQWKPQF